MPSTIKGVLSNRWTALPLEMTIKILRKSHLITRWWRSAPAFHKPLPEDNDPGNKTRLNVQSVVLILKWTGKITLLNTIQKANICLQSFLVVFSSALCLCGRLEVKTVHPQLSGIVVSRYVSGPKFKTHAEVHNTSMTCLWRHANMAAPCALFT